jgi:hypothetical protein
MLVRLIGKKAKDHCRRSSPLMMLGRNRSICSSSLASLKSINCPSNNPPRRKNNTNLSDFGSIQPYLFTSSFTPETHNFTILRYDCAKCFIHKYKFSISPFNRRKQFKHNFFFASSSFCLSNRLNLFIIYSGFFFEFTIRTLRNWQTFFSFSVE